MKKRILYNLFNARGANVVFPIVTAPTQVGNNFTLNSTYSSYQWNRNGVAISGATGATYTATHADLYKFISCTVNGSLTSEEVKFEDANVVIYFDPANCSTMFQETSANGNNHTVVSANSQTVGSIYSLAPGGWCFGTATNTNRPTYNGNVNRNAFLTGAASSFSVANGNIREYLRFLHGVNSNWSLIFWIQSTVDGTNKDFFRTKGTGATTPGLFIRVSSTNNIFIRIADNTNQQSYTTTASLTVASGWTRVYIQKTSGANNCKIRVGTAAEESFTITSGADILPEVALNFLVTGINLSHLALRNRLLTPVEIADFDSHNPSQNDDDWISEKWLLDFNDTTLGFSDAAETINVTNGSIVRAWRNKVTLPISFSRELQSDSDATSPVWQSNIINGRGGLFFDAPGSGATRDAALDLLKLFFREVNTNAQIHQDGSGAQFAIFVGRNRDADNGSHLLVTQNYMVWTGSNYTGLFNDAYMVRHGEGGNSAGGILLTNNSEGNNIAGWRRIGSFNEEYVTSGASQTSTQAFPFGRADSHLGSRFSALNEQWAMDGYIYYIAFHAGKLSDTRFRAIFNQIRNLYGL